MTKLFSKITTLSLTLLVAGAWAAEAPAPKITIKVAGETKFEGTIEDLKKVQAPQTIKLVEPQLEKERSYQAFDFKALMTKLKATQWEKSKSLKITCIDGYSPVVVVSNLKKDKPFLAFAAADKETFGFVKEGKPTDFGPLYLVWTKKMTAAQRKLDLNAGNWPYQIATLSFE